MAESLKDAPLLVERITCASGHAIGLLTLNAPQSLNALSLPMIDQMQAVLDEWVADEQLVCVLLRGAGDKAFCAGGDIVDLYRSMMAHEAGAENRDALAFFSREYRLDYTLHTYPKPLIVWGTGYVMGGGLGLMAGCRYRLVTETSRIAMPEISIGLFPDVGGTWFLNRMPEGYGLFLGLTGAQCNAADALALGWADHFIAADKYPALLERLRHMPWKHAACHHVQVSTCLSEFGALSKDAMPPGEIARHHSTIEQVTRHASLQAVVAAILALETNTKDEDRWLSRAQRALAKGCPTTAHLVWRQLHEGRDLSLAEVFRRELIMAVQCAQHAEFREGVRALLIDKDNQPRWRFTDVASVPDDYIDEFFASPWPQAHPLADLS